MKKILFVSNEYKIGGSSVSLKSLIVGMREVLPADTEIVVVLPWNFPWNRPAKKFFEAEGIRCKEFLYRNNYRYVDRKETFTILGKKILNRMAVRPLSRYIRKMRFDRVCSNSSAVDVGAKAAAKTGIFHVFYVREFMQEDHGLEYVNPTEMATLLESADEVIFISKAIAAKYETMYQLKSTTQFYDGFVLEDYFLAGRSILEDDMLHIVQLGRLNDGKGALNSIELMKMLRDSGIDKFCLEFYGTGNNEYIQKMQELISKYGLEEHISISPFVSNVLDKLAKADVLLMNSRAEGFGRVTVEGMLAGCLVLGRESAGTKEIIVHGKTGFMFKEDAQAVVWLKDIAEKPEHYRKIVQVGQSWAAEEFDCVRTAEKFCKSIYETK